MGTAEYSERDVARLLMDTSAVDLLYRTVRGERAAFRLFHEALAEYLRQESTRYRSAAQTQRRLTEVLLAHVPRTPAGGRDWSRADEYTRTYLPVHAAERRSDWTSCWVRPGSWPPLSLADCWRPCPPRSLAVAGR